jgi:hypothetical protein
LLDEVCEDGFFGAHLFGPFHPVDDFGGKFHSHLRKFTRPLFYAEALFL